MVFLSGSQRPASLSCVPDPSFLRPWSLSPVTLWPSLQAQPQPTHGPAVPGLQGDVAVEQPVVLGVRRLLRTAGRGLSGQRVVRRGRAGVAPRSEVAPVQ